MQAGMLTMGGVGLGTDRGTLAGFGLGVSHASNGENPANVSWSASMELGLQAGMVQRH